MSFTCIGEALEQTHPEPFAVQYYQHHYLPNPANPDFAIGDAITSLVGGIAKAALEKFPALKYVPGFSKLAKMGDSTASN
ncbi:MAG: hypothetical protein HOI01_02850, partial [Proteobacteria bacterium]|nr:hypothetical protein [Pseudomonadota bacterium]